MSEIYLRQGDEFSRLAAQHYEAESLLQALLGEHPELMSGGNETEEGRGWVLIQREAPISSEADGSGRWRLDHLFLDSEGIPTLVEVKRSSDTRIRREVVGQMLDYAANASALWQVEHLRERFAATCAEQDEDPDARIRAVFPHYESADAYWERVRANLQAERLRLVFVADEIPPELRRIVEFLNDQMQQTEVIAIEVKQYVGESRQIFVPQVLGRTQAAARAKGRAAARRWDLDSVAGELDRRHEPPLGEIVRRIHAWARARGLSTGFGSGSKDGSFQAGLDDGTHYLWPFTVYTYGRVEIPFLYIARRPPFDDPALRTQLVQRLNELPGVDLDTGSIDQRPSIDLGALSEPASLRTFLETMEWALEQARAEIRPRTL